MRNLKKFLAVVIALTLMVTAMAPAAFAADEFQYENEATALQDLGLISGDGNGNLNLDGELDRAQGVTIVLKLFGYQSLADEMTEDDIAAALEGFEDADAAKASWAAAWLALGVSEGLISGTTDGRIAADAPFTGKMLAALILKKLGYTLTPATYSKAAAELAKVGGLTAQEVIFNDEQLNRDAAFGMMYNALGAKYADEDTTIAQQLIADGILAEDVEGIPGLAVPTEETPAEAQIVSLENGKDVAVEYGSDIAKADLPKTVKATFDDESTADVAVTWDVKDVDTEKSGDYTVTGAVEGTDVTAALKVTVKVGVPVVVSATGSNYKEINVAFNKTVDAATVKVENFKVGGVNAAAVSLSDNKKVVTVSVPTAIPNPIPRFVEYALAVANVKDAEGYAVASYSTTVRIYDTTVPEAVSIKTSAPDHAVITFSEPITQGAPSVIVNNGTVGSSVESVSGNTATITFSTLTNGTVYDVRVNGFVDASGLTMKQADLKFTYTKDTAPITVALEGTPQQTEVKVKFSKPLANAGSLTTNYFYHTFDSWHPNSVTDSGDHQIFTLRFDKAGSYPIAQGAFTLFVLKSYNDVKLLDQWGNEMAANASISSSVTADTTAPTVAFKKQEAQDKISVIYSESVVKAAAENKANYVVKDASGTAQAITSVTETTTDGVTYYVIDFDNNLAGGAYSVVVSNVTDNALVANTVAANSIAFNVTDVTSPSFIADDENNDPAQYVAAPSGAKYIYLMFNEAMATTGAGSVLDKNNYRIANVDMSSDAVKIEAFKGSNKKIRITLPSDLATVPTQVIYGKLADTSGNFITGLNGFQGTVAVTNVSGTHPLISAIKTIANNRVEITFNALLDGVVSANAFNITVGTGAQAKTYTAAMVMTSVNNDGNTVVTATLQSPYNVDYSIGAGSTDITVTILATDPALVSDTGLSVATGADNVTPIDGIAPTFSDAVDSGAGNTISVQYNENLDATYAALYATDLVVRKADGTVLVAGIDYTTTVVGNAIIVTNAKAQNGAFAAGDYYVKSKDSITYITDLAGNKAKTFGEDKATIS